MREARDLTREGRYEDAEILAREALNFAEKTFEPGKLPIIHSLKLLGNILQRDGRFEEATDMLEQALAALEKRLESGDLDREQQAERLLLMDLLTGQYTRLQRHIEAKNMATRALRLRSVLHSDLDDEFLGHLLLLAELNLRAGLPGAAAECQQRLVQLFRRRYGEDDPTVAVALGDMAWLLIRAGRRSEAEDAITQVVSNLTTCAEMNRITHMTPVIAMSRRLLSEGFGGQLEPLLRTVVELHKKHSWFPVAAVGNCMKLLGHTERNRGNLTAAEAWYLRALPLLAQSRKVDPLSMVRCLRALAQVLAETSREAEAIEQMRQAVALLKVREVDHPEELAGAIVDLANIQFVLGEYAAAEKELVEAVALFGESMTGQVSALASVLGKLVLMYADQDDLEKLVPYLLRLLRIGQPPASQPSVLNDVGVEQTLILGKQFGSVLVKTVLHLVDTKKYQEVAWLLMAAHPERERLGVDRESDLLRILPNVALLLEDDNHLREAIALYTWGLEIVDAVHQGKHRYLIVLLECLNRAYIHLGDYHQAIPLLERQVAAMERSDETPRPMLIRRMRDLGFGYRRLSRPDEAQQIFRRLIPLIEAQAAGDPRELAQAYYGLADVQLVLQEYEEAVLHYARALELAESGFGPLHPFIIWTVRGKAQCHIHLNEPDVARQLLARVVKDVERALSPDDPDLVIGLDGVAKAYREIGDETAAKEVDAQIRRIQSQRR